MNLDELRGVFPAEMHRFAPVFLHPPSAAGGPMMFELQDMLAQAVHLDRLGFEQVRDPIDGYRYIAPQSGPVHPQNPGRWAPERGKDKVEAPSGPAPIDEALERAQQLSPADREELLRELTGMSSVEFRAAVREHVNADKEKEQG